MSTRNHIGWKVKRCYVRQSVWGCSFLGGALFRDVLFLGAQPSKTHSAGKKDLPESTASFEQNRKVKSAYQCCQSSKSGDSGRMKFLSSRHTDNIDRPIPLYDNNIFWHFGILTLWHFNKLWFFNMLFSQHVDFSKYWFLKCWISQDDDFSKCWFLQMSIS